MSIRYYRTAAGKEPFMSWMDRLSVDHRGAVHAYVRRVSHGASQNNVTAIKGHHPLKEIRVAKTGLRVYFIGVEYGMLILSGGAKDTQARDVKTAYRYWRDYVESERIIR